MVLQSFIEGLCVLLGLGSGGVIWALPFAILFLCGPYPDDHPVSKKRANVIWCICKIATPLFILSWVGAGIAYQFR